MKHVHLSDMHYEDTFCTAYNPSFFTTKMQKKKLIREAYKITVTNPKALKECSTGTQKFHQQVLKTNT